MATAAPIDLDDAHSLALVGARRIAMVGASDDPNRDSFGVLKALLDAGFDVVPVNPNVNWVLGQQSFHTLAAVPGHVDVVDVFRAPEHLPDVARQAVDRGDVGVVWNQLGLVSDEAREIVRSAGMGYVEDRCMKVEVQQRGIRASRAPRLTPDAMLLDLDDTILDHDTCERRAVAATLKAFRIESNKFAIDAYARHNAELWAQYRQGGITPTALRTERWDRTLRDLGVVADVASVSAHYLEEFSSTGALLPGAAEAMWWLARRTRVAICTNGFRAVQEQRLAATGLDRLVDAFASSEEAGVAKPDPAPLRLALSRLGVDDEDADVVMVGDQFGTDVAAGHAIGATTVWVAPEVVDVPDWAAAPHHRVERLAQLA